MNLPRPTVRDAVSPLPTPHALELPPAGLGIAACFILAAGGFCVDQVVSSLAWNVGHPVLGFAVGGILGGILPLAIVLRGGGGPGGGGLGRGGLGGGVGGGWVHGERGHWRGGLARGLLGARPSWSELGLAVWIVGSAVPPLYALSGAVARVFPPPDSQLEIYRALVPRGWIDVLGGGVAVLVVAPLAEEILFRGLLLRAFAGLVWLPIAVLSGGLLFGASHGSLWSFLPLAGLGILLGLLVWRTRALAAAWLGHGLFNLVAYAELCVTHDVRGARLEAWASQPWVWIPATAVLGWGLLHLRRGLPEATSLEAPYLVD